MSTKKLIEVSIPLEKINEASAREKSIRHKHPSTLHLWWSRKPLATTRAVLWASLVDDPEDDQKREALHKILVDLVKWENTNNPETLRKAREALPDSLPELLDPFAGGGSIPLEGQRLGLKVHAHDLNPIAVILNKAMVELPAKFCSLPPVNPEARRLVGWEHSGNGTHGLAQDIRYYGARLKEQAFARIGRMYPQVRTRDGELTVIAWLWARTVMCPNPACGCEMPLVSSWELSKKQGVFVQPHYVDGKLSFSVKGGKAPASPKSGKGKFVCSACGSVVDNEYLHEEFCAHRDGVRMIAVVAEGEKGRVYVRPDAVQEGAADVGMPEDFPDAEMNQDTTDLISGRGYGFTHWHELFTARQLTMLTTIADTIPEVVAEAERDAEISGDRDAREYAEAVRVYLAFVLDKLTQYNSAFCLWDVTRDGIAQIFGRQAIPMVWNFAESNPFCSSSGCFDNMLGWVVDTVENLPGTPQGTASQHDAQQQDNSLRNLLISTDPPYYDNIGYADLSDYFYIWLRRTLRGTYPELFRRVLTPKDEELVAAPHRHGGNRAASRSAFESGMFRACKNLYDCAGSDYPTTIYYAYKSGDKDGGSSGWETMLSAVIEAGFQITATWPMRTELTTALKAKVAALASSVVLVCRKRSPDAPGTTRAEFLRELSRELGPALAKMQAGNIAAVDLPQSAIGPGMAVYSRYSDVSSADGKSLTIHDALIEINAAVDEILLGVEMDSMSRFCVDVYRIAGWNAVKAGEAITLATGRGISLDGLENAGLVIAEKGSVRLTPREELKSEEMVSVWGLAQRLTLARETGGTQKDGIAECARIIHALGLGNAEKAKNLAYLLYKTADTKRWQREATMYNQLVMSWVKILEFEAGIRQTLPDRQVNFEREMED